MIYTGDALEILKNLPSESVHCVVTSPPYYGLRDYGVDGQIGLEASLNDYIATLTVVFGEVRRVLRNDGTLWLNLGDSYYGSGKGSANYPDNAKKYKQGTNRGTVDCPNTIIQTQGAAKNLMGVPWRVALALQDRGWNLRQDIIWAKPNPMPESVTDRCTKAHEYIFLISKNSKYYFDIESMQEPAVGFNDAPVAGSLGAMGGPQLRRRKGNAKTFRGGIYTNNKEFANDVQMTRDSHGNSKNITGTRNKRDVWNIATTSCPEAHFATFPPALIRPCIKAGCPVGGIVLDPFFGAGTTGIVCIEENREYIGIEINPAYVEIAKRRIAKVARTGSLIKK